ncbi:uncharacterized protein LOC129584320 [Paramacrobiotus metropolitanus]|uniref:uncharacterized protein LOC129584320 n=1 Tax=Paramacrobiotus metropolitanus TaxID=2943436 RepID=UPI002445C0A4|nr:uncharacterized protein LOC129584320 [Paramacrobiotus metropolitanus]
MSTVTDPPQTSAPTSPLSLSSLNQNIDGGLSSSGSGQTVTQEQSSQPKTVPKQARKSSGPQKSAFISPADLLSIPVQSAPEISINPVETSLSPVFTTSTIPVVTEKPKPKSSNRSQSFQKVRSHFSAAQLVDQFVAGNRRAHSAERTSAQSNSSNITTDSRSNEIPNKPQLKKDFPANNVNNATVPPGLIESTTTTTAAKAANKTDQPLKALDSNIVFTTTVRSTTPNGITTAPLLQQWLHLYCWQFKYPGYPLCVDYLNIGSTGSTGALKFAGGSCPISQFKCDNENCVYRSMLCDGRDDCKDNSDEGPLAKCGKAVNNSNTTTVAPADSVTEIVFNGTFLATADQLAEIFAQANKPQNQGSRVIFLHDLAGNLGNLTIKI